MVGKHLNFLPPATDRYLLPTTYHLASWNWCCNTHDTDGPKTVAERDTRRAQAPRSSSTGGQSSAAVSVVCLLFVVGLWAMLSGFPSRDELRNSGRNAAGVDALRHP